MSLYVNDSLRLDSILINYTAGWDVFKTMEAGLFEMSPSDTLLKISIIKGGFNLAAMTFSYADAPVSIRESMHTELSIYPVPANNVVFVRGIPENSDLVLFDSKGSIIQKIRIAESPQLKLDISSYNEGLYFIKVLSPSGKSLNGKFIRSIENY